MYIDVERGCILVIVGRGYITIGSIGVGHLSLVGEVQTRFLLPLLCQ